MTSCNWVLIKLCIKFNFSKIKNKNKNGGWVVDKI